MITNIDGFHVTESRKRTHHASLTEANIIGVPMTEGDVEWVKTIPSNQTSEEESREDRGRPTKDSPSLRNHPEDLPLSESEKNPLSVARCLQV